MRICNTPFINEKTMCRCKNDTLKLSRNFSIYLINNSLFFRHLMRLTQPPSIDIKRSKFLLIGNKNIKAQL
jgi:hypothetical protein